VARGIGYVTGAEVTVRLLPAAADSGIRFVRTDLPGRPTVPALWQHVQPRSRRTALAAGPAVVELTEHVLGALAGYGIDNCTVELNAVETPGMDGSAAAFVQALIAAGTRDQEAPRRPLVVERPLVVRAGDALAAVLPNDGKALEITFNLDYADGAVGRQSRYYRLCPATFANEIAPARTFILRREVEALRQQGIGTRSTAKDLLVFDDDGRLLDNELRFADECVRHKILDVIGDLALAGRPIHGHVLAHKSGHQLNARLVQLLLQENSLEA
jgi:UDP-3-O-acyl N-acetylglucosamine deacetylase